MLIKQISVFVENKFGRLAKIVELLGQESIDISALSMADTTEFGVLRLIVDKPEYAVEVLKKNGVVSKCTDVVAVALDDKPGGLSSVLDSLTKNQIAIEYMYAFVGKKAGKALMVVRTDNMEKTAKALKKDDIELFNLSDIY